MKGLIEDEIAEAVKHTGKAADRLVVVVDPCDRLQQILKVGRCINMVLGPWEKVTVTFEEAAKLLSRLCGDLGWQLWRLAYDPSEWGVLSLREHNATRKNRR